MWKLHFDKHGIFSVKHSVKHISQDISQTIYHNISNLFPKMNLLNHKYIFFYIAFSQSFSYIMLPPYRNSYCNIKGKSFLWKLVVCFLDGYPPPLYIPYTYIPLQIASIVCKRKVNRNVAILRARCKRCVKWWWLHLIKV